ncbi:ABC transporter permease [Parabacteroides sp. PF5-6]|uniref:ABC transporter permease n=1 Tax=Parabacteroides sp. PF5-6 TaxID=1742403 RepID=UPI002406CAF5|nr:ABC transporter permease [Parabacteroides sp. PF5-6]MDF9828974.1 putative ABC transport system permease protein [Parabacteroides sp. PF5-6]
MIKHYIKTTFRNLWKYKAQSLTGIFGLAFAMACFVPALYWMRYETSYDSFYPDAGQIYRIYAVDRQSGKVNERVPGILEKQMRAHFPAIKASTFLIPESNNCKAESMPHIRLQTLNTDSTFFRVFAPQFVSGDANEPFHSELDIVLTESTAIGLFGDVEKAIGQHIQSTFYFFHPPYTVRAVVKDPSPNTNLPYDALLCFDVGYGGMPEQMQWMEFNAEVYVALNPHADVDSFAAELRDFASRFSVDIDVEIRLVPIRDVRHRLNANTPFTLNFIQLFVAAGVLLLFSALFNFLNLYLDLFRRRIREMRQRAVHGAKKRQLIRQMLFELGCTVLLAFVLGGCLVIVVRPLFSRLLDLAMEMPELIRLFVWCAIGVITVMLWIGWLTFWRLSHLALQPLSKGKTVRGPLLRRMAVVLQLAVSMVFLVAASVVMKQMRFADQKDLGFNRSGIIQLHGLSSHMENRLRVPLLEALETIPQIEKIATSIFMPQHNANALELISVVEWPGKTLDEKPTFNVISTGSRFAETLGLEMLEGRWWGEGDGEQNVVLNEEAVRVMGLTEPVGTTIRLSINNVEMEVMEKERDVNYRVVGVVKDFHTLSLRSRIHPTIFRPPYEIVGGQIVMDNILYLQVTAGQEQEVIQRLRAVLPDVDPAFADLQLTTLDALYDSFNHSEQVGLQLFSVLATVCLLISLFGIYAVATAATQRRRKEIAIRKVAGAKADDIIRLFFREYILLVCIAAAFALPVAYLAMSRWLQGYAYRTDIPWWLLAGTIVGVVAVVLLTVFGQVRKAANSNPAEVVKAE